MTTNIEEKLTLTPLRKTPWYAYPLIICVMLAVYFVMTNVHLVLTDSIEATVMWPSKDEPAQGDYVTFTLVHKVIPTKDNSVKVTKILSCAANHYLRKVDKVWYCDETKIGTSRSHAINGDELDQFSWNGPVPIGKAFVTGTNEHSFDSRYWGFIDAAALKKVNKVF